MSDTRSSIEDHYKAEIYKIRVQGHFHNRWAERFEGLTITRESDGTTVLCGPLPDQTALHSILLRIRDMNLKLISVSRTEPSSPDTQSAGVEK